MPARDKSAADARFVLASEGLRKVVDDWAAEQQPDADDARVISGVSIETLKNLLGAYLAGVVVFCETRAAREAVSGSEASS